MIRAGGAGAGGCGGAACGARVRLPPPLSPALARRPAPPSGPECCGLDFAPRRALLLLRAGPCSVQAAAGKPEAKCSPDPRPSWLKSPSTSLSCRESRKVGAGPWSARRAPPAPSAGSLPREEGLPSLGGPRGLRLVPTGCRPALVWRKLNSGSAVGPWASHLSSEPQFFPSVGRWGRGQHHSHQVVVQRFSGVAVPLVKAPELGASDLFLFLKIQAQPGWLEGWEVGSG